MNITTPSGSVIPYVSVPNAYDYESIQAANAWNTTHQMVAQNPPSLPIAVQQIIFGKVGNAFVNNYFLDWKAGITSSSVQLSLRDNSVTSGDFQNSGAGTVPAFIFPTGATFGNTGRNLQLTLLKPGRFNLGIRVVDSATNTSMFELELIALP